MRARPCGSLQAEAATAARVLQDGINEKEAQLTAKDRELEAHAAMVVSDCCHGSWSLVRMHAWHATCPGIACLLQASACVLRGTGTSGRRFVHTDTLLLPATFDTENIGLAFHRAANGGAGVLAATNARTHTVAIIDAGTGAVIKTFGGKGSDGGQFAGPLKVCFTPLGNLLVAEWANGRIQEVTVDGAHVRYIGAPKGKATAADGICGIATNGRVIAVGKFSNDSSERVRLFDFASGRLKHSFGVYGVGDGGQVGNVRSITFAPNGEDLLIADGIEDTNRISLFQQKGERIATIATGTSRCTGALFLGSEDAVLATDGATSALRLYSLATGAQLDSWGGEGSLRGQFQCPNALFVDGRHLYVLDRLTNRLQRFYML